MKWIKTTFFVLLVFTIALMFHLPARAQEPQLVSSSPANGATDVPVSNRTISFTFDQGMGPGYSVTWSGVDVTPSFVSWSSDKKTIYFVYPTDLPAGRTIGWVLNPSTHDPNFRSEAGVPLPPDLYSGSFSTTPTPTPTQFTIDASVQHCHPENYYLGITVMGGGFSSVEIIGPNITSVWQHPQAPDHTVVSLSDRPNVGDTYIIRIHYAGTFEDKTYSVDGVNDNFAWISSPPDGSTVSTLTPTFTWQEANNINSYHLKVADNEGNWIWAKFFPAGTSSCDYNFDGGATASLQSGKTYRIYLHTFDANGNQATTQSTFTVQTSNQPPEAKFTMTSGGQTKNENETLNLTVSPGGTAHVDFSASGSSDPDGSISGYRWYIDDSEVSTDMNFDGDLGAGTHQISLTVTDNQGAEGSAEASIVITEQTQDDYPYRDYNCPNCVSDPCGTDDWDFYIKNCTSFVAWRMNRDGGEGSFTNNMNGGHWGNAYNWDDNAQFLGLLVNQIPAPGAIAQWEAAAWNNNFGHVAYVESVNDDETINISEYNYTLCSYSERRISINDVDHYIHVNTATMLITPGGGTVGLPDGSASVYFPPEAIPNEVFVSIVQVDETSVPPPTGGLQLLGSVYDFSAVDAEGNSITEFDDFLQITLQFDPADLNGLDPVIHYYDGESWVALQPPAQFVDYDNNTVTAFTDHFSWFGIFGIPEPSTLLLFGTGLIGILVLARRTLKKRK